MLKACSTLPLASHSHTSQFEAIQIFLPRLSLVRFFQSWISRWWICGSAPPVQLCSVDFCCYCMGRWYGNLIWVCCMDMLSGYVAWICGLGMLYGYVVWIDVLPLAIWCSLKQYHGESTWTGQVLDACDSRVEGACACNARKPHTWLLWSRPWCSLWSETPVDYWPEPSTFVLCPKPSHTHRRTPVPGAFH